MSKNKQTEKDKLYDKYVKFIFYLFQDFVKEKEQKVCKGCKQVCENKSLKHLQSFRSLIIAFENQVITNIIKENENKGIK